MRGLCFPTRGTAISRSRLPADRRRESQIDTVAAAPANSWFSSNMCGLDQWALRWSCPSRRKDTNADEEDRRWSLRPTAMNALPLPGGNSARDLDCDLHRRTVLKFGAGISAFSVASREPVSEAVLANNGEIVALSARAAADYMRRGDLSAERYARVLLDRYKAHTNLNAVTYIDVTRYRCIASRRRLCRLKRW